MNDIETHPFEPWLPANAKLLMLGTFPPAPKRWAMEWYYPNFTNDMWRIFGLIFFNDKNKFVDTEHHTYYLDSLKVFLQQKGIAIFDTCLRIIRTTGTASDKDLEVVEHADLDGNAAQLADAERRCSSRTAGNEHICRTFRHRHAQNENGRQQAVHV